MKNAMQLKAIIKNLAKEKHISAQLVMQNFMLEKLLERISVSKYQLQYSNIEQNALKAALDATTKKRGSKSVVRDYRKIMDTVRNSGIMQKQWDNYQKDFEYAAGIAFSDVCDTVVQLMDAQANA